MGMSTKTFPGPGPGQWKNIAIFLVLSLSLHLGILAIISVTPLAKTLIQRAAPKEEQVPVDVVELPPGAAAKEAARKPPAYYSDRTHGVEKETSPGINRGLSKGGIRNLPSGPAAPYSDGAKARTPYKADRDLGPKKAEKPAASTQVKPSEGDIAVPPEKTEEKAAQSPGPQAIERPETEAIPAPRAKKPNLFPTSERLAELDKKYQAEPPKGEKGKTLQLNTSEMRYARYVLGMKDRIYRFWEYPEIALRNGWQGKLMVDFLINKDGKVDDIKVVKSSGYPALDEAVTMALRLASPFAPLPGDFEMDGMTIHGQFEYQIQYAPGRN